MRTPTLTRTRLPLALGVTVVTLVIACSAPANKAAEQSTEDLCATRLAIFDTLDYDVFSNQKWNRLSESHANDIIVSWPDGHDTNGIDKHIEDLKAMFVYAPNTSIKEHPIRICSGDYTAVMGLMTGTFSQPMPTPDGKSIAPTGKSFRLPMATIGLWKGTTMTHEWLFWDNQTYMRQIGLAP
jgi:hypothetical protein